MTYHIFLCDKEWEIQRILHVSADLKNNPANPIKPKVRLTELLENPLSLTDNEDLDAQKQLMVSLRFLGVPKEIPAIICNYSKYFLVILAHVRDEEDYKKFADLFSETLSWAEENLQLPYQDEYFQIQQMNNQLINSQRALMRSNQQLKQVLDEIRDANTTIALLEHDDLTNLYCLSSFYRKARKRLAESNGQTFDIIVLDIERFKLVNEIFGRKAGDQLLQSLAMFLLSLSGADHGILARASADTFYMMMPGELKFYETLGQEMPMFFKSYPLPVRIGEKIGVYSDSNADTSISIEQMCDRALLALDTIQPQSLSRVAFYNHSLHESLLLEHRILDSVPDALENREFKLFLQPKVDIRSGEVIGAEALIRWIHPELGFIAPDKFIPLLEKEGDIYHVDQFIWEEACRILKTRKEMGLRSLPISVNVARGDLYQNDLCDVLTNLIKTYGLDASLLRLEILERVYVRDSSNLFEILTNLRNHGFLIEMDDFGTGESSLSMVAKMPIDVLKLDRQFIVSCLQDPRQMEIIRFIVQLAKTLDMKIIAEGVETREQADFLLSLGCLYAQGYFYGKPEPADAFLKVP